MRRRKRRKRGREEERKRALYISPSLHTHAPFSIKLIDHPLAPLPNPSLPLSFFICLDPQARRGASDTLDNMKGKIQDDVKKVTLLHLALHRTVIAVI